MAIVIDDIIKLWKLAKGAHSLNKVGNSPIARALGYSNQIDQMIQEYRGKVSADRLKQMKKELMEIKLELEQLLTAQLSVSGVDGANKAILKTSENLTTMQAAEFARLELMRIYYEQEREHLPLEDPSPRQLWMPKRQAFLRILPFYRTFATQMTGAALRAQRDIERASQNQNAARLAAAEVRRQNEKDAAEQLEMLQADNAGFLSDERAAIYAREQFLILRKWALEQDQRIRELIDVGDLMFLKS